MASREQVERITAVLPQTQCRQCGFDGCVPYARALADGAADIHLCTPGGETVMHDLSALLQRPPRALAQAEKAAAPKALAVIDEAECIGCTACIKACPVDAILGASKQMHTVLADECTGCELCLPPCPVDCIRMEAVADAWLPRARSLVSGSLNERAAAAQQARLRHEHKTARTERLNRERAAHLAARRAAVQNKQNHHAEPHAVPNAGAPQTPAKPAVDAAALIAKAMQRAAENRKQGRAAAPINQDEFRRREIAKAQERATYRRAIRDFQYGSAEEKAAAQVFLREYREREEAQKNG